MTSPAHYRDEGRGVVTHEQYLAIRSRLGMPVMVQSVVRRYRPPVPVATVAVPLPPPETAERVPFDFLRPPNWRNLVAFVALKHGARFSQILGPKRWAEMTKARREACYLISTHTYLSLTKMGQRMNRDHTTVLYNIRMHQKHNPSAVLVPRHIGAVSRGALAGKAWRERQKAARVKAKT